MHEREGNNVLPTVVMSGRHSKRHERARCPVIVDSGGGAVGGGCRLSPPRRNGSGLVTGLSAGYCPTMKTFGQVLESADRLPLEEREPLVTVLQRQVAEQRRAQLVEAAKEARREFKAGRCRAAAADQIVKKLVA